MFASMPDLLRLLVLLVFAWAALRDLRTRRLPASMWYPLVALGLVLVGWELSVRHPFAGVGDRLYLVRVAISLFLVAPIGLVLGRVVAFGGADAKAIATLAVLFPTYPIYRFAGVVLPHERTALGLFALTVITNAALLGLLYPVALALRNLAVGDVSPAMFVGRRVSIADLPYTHGWLMETREGLIRRGLDLDALRMYLRWRGSTLTDLHRNPDGYRDPASVGSTFDPTDGAVNAGAETDGGYSAADESLSAASTRASSAPTAADTEDPWAADMFLADVDGTAYGTSPATLREGLETLSTRDRVWVSIGTPFIVPLFAGLVAALTFGDILFATLRLVGLV